MCVLGPETDCESQEMVTTVQLLESFVNGRLSAQNSVCTVSLNPQVMMTP